MSLKSLLALLLITCYAIPASAESVALVKGLNEFIDKAISCNPSIAAANARVDKYRAVKEEHDTLLNPAIMTGFRYYPGESDEFGYGARYRGTVSLNMSLLKQFRQRKLYWEEGETLIEHAKSRIDQNRQDAIYIAVQVYMNAVIAESRREYAHKLVDAARENLEYYQQRQKEHEARTLDILEAKKQILEAELLLKESQEECRLYLEQLNTMIPNGFSLEVVPEWIILPNTPLNPLIDTFINTHPDIREYDQLINLENIRLRLDRADNIDLQMNVGYHVFGKDEFLNSDSFAFRLWTDFPLFFMKQDRFRTNQHEAMINQLRNEKRERANELRWELNQALARIEWKLELKTILKQDLELALEKFRVAEAAIWLGRDREKYLYDDLLYQRFKAKQEALEAELNLDKWHYEISMQYADMLRTAAALSNSGAFFQTAKRTGSFKKATWFYQKKRIVDKVEWDTVVHFCRDHDIKRLFVAIGYPSDLFSLFQNQERYAAFIRFLHKADIEVHLLMGDGSWCKSEQLAELQKRMLSIIEFYHSYTTYEGIHFDIEPQSLPEWDNPSNRERLIRYFPKLLSVLTEMVRESLPKVTITADIPVWFDNQRIESWSNNDNLLVRTFEIVDEVVLMDYYTNVKTIMQKAKEELVQARIHKKPIWIGLKVTKDKSNSLDTSFHSIGKQVLQKTMEEIYHSIQVFYPEFQGFGVYNYSGYTSMEQ